MADLVLGLAKSAVEGTMTMAKSAIEEEKKLRKGVQLDLMLISDEFEMMHSFLNVSQDHVTDDVARTLVKQVRNMALDVEDCIESVIHLDGKANWWRRMLPSCMPAAAPGADLDAAIADIELLKARVEAMGQRNLRYSRMGVSSPKPVENTRQQAVANATASDILARAREAAEKQSRRLELVELITKRDCHQLLQVIPVLGTVGMMSIIKRAYDDPEICKHFSCRAWVKLTHPFNPHEFVHTLLDQFYKNDGSPMVLEVVTGDALIQEFIKKMSNLKYLVVLEEVSTMVDWEAVRVYLPDRNNGSCIVVSTNQIEVASLCVGYPHQVLELEKLSTDHSVYVLFKEDGNDINASSERGHGEMDIMKVEETVEKLEIARQWLHNHQLVAREMDLSWLSCFFSPGRMVSLWGMSGVGKSFIIKHFYYNIQLDYKYRHYKFGWVNVSYPFNLMDLSRSLLLDLNPGSVYHSILSTVKDPIQEFREYLHEHKCCIVIDGLQSMQEWDLTKAALDLGSSRCCIIVITNEESVAKYCAADSNSIWNVKGLQFDRALELLKMEVQSRAGNKPVEWSTEIAEGARRILHKCGGLPKVILALAELLTYKCTEEVLRQDNVVSMLEDNASFLTQNLGDLFAWLRSYFRSCPDFLKPCIFYLTIFPVNHPIRRRRFVWRWIAEGYCRDKKESTAEENGEMSFRKLINLSMIHVPGTISLNFAYRRMPLCRINGFLREYIISRSMEENLVFALEGHSRKHLQRTGRHLTIDKSWDRDRNVFESIDFTRLRSLTVFGRWEPFLVTEKMRLLRVLDLEDVSSGVANSDLEQMVKLLPRLKFLSLRGCAEINHLPDSLGDLKQLQTLDIRETSVAKLPKSIINLEKLQYIRAGNTNTKHYQATGAVPMSRPCDILVPRLSRHHRPLDVRCYYSGVKVPRGAGKLSDLHTLGVIDISTAGGGAILEELEKLTQLHKLGVSGINGNNAQGVFSAILGLAHLESLLLQVQLDEEAASCCLDGVSTKAMESLLSLKLYGLGRKVPVWTKELCHVRKLTLQMTVLPQESVDHILGLPMLEDLRLFLSGFQGDELHFGSHAGFSLGVLEITCESRIQGTITFHKNEECGSFLKVLRIRCWHMSSLRLFGLQHLRDLKDVWLSGPYCDDGLKQHLESVLAEYPAEEGKPVLMLEELGSSNPWLRSSS